METTAPAPAVTYAGTAQALSPAETIAEFHYRESVSAMRGIVSALVLSVGFWGSVGGIAVFALTR
ncbi:hypothetical protein [Microbacterium sp. 77mftsu3.1]|uniref:hypothetical protein n=1 Tax=Microbacterium sp. 77mftsu3.1 TaxID=1761802 RepID=UPI00039DADB7|nr:hypothetical protein [Microbacterium sp. 77mftsu3.1]